jgi:serine/threonine protein kinase
MHLPFGVVQVLADCHRRQLVHGDVKPENIMNSVDKSVVTLIDFGSASVWSGMRTLPLALLW